MLLKGVSGRQPDEVMIEKRSKNWMADIRESVVSRRHENELIGREGVNFQSGKIHDIGYDP